jgi:hypothetical protein
VSRHFVQGRCGGHLDRGVGGDGAEVFRHDDMVPGLHSERGFDDL